MQRKHLLIVSMCIVLAGVGWFAKGVYIQAKAMLAQQLLEDAWQQTLDGKDQVKPWSWADTWPVARLAFPGKDIELIVLDGASGSSLAFGPGYLHGTAQPGQFGFSVISAHRDTHFRFLQRVRKGDQILLQQANGAMREYKVVKMKVVDQAQPVIPQTEQVRGLMLVTCYPFNALKAGGRLRYVVYAVEVDKGGVDV